MFSLGAFLEPDTVKTVSTQLFIQGMLIHLVLNPRFLKHTALPSAHTDYRS